MVNRNTERYYPSDNFPPGVSQEVTEEARLIRDAVYDLRDSRKALDIIDQTITADFEVNPIVLPQKQLVAGRFSLWILRQDIVGAHTITFTSVFKGVNLITPVTTASTYSTFKFYHASASEALLVSWLSGGTL